MMPSEIWITEESDGIRIIHESRQEAEEAVEIAKKYYESPNDKVVIYGPYVLMNKISLMLIEIQHIYGERRVFEIETIYPTFVSIRWGLNGIYDIDVKTGIMKARSAKARRKGQCYWKAADVEALRKLVNDYFANRNGKSEEQEYRDFLRHIDSMPKYEKDTVVIKKV